MTNAFGRARMVALLLVSMLVPAVARAHAHLLRSEPAKDARLATAPTSLRLWFSEAPQLAITRIVLLGPSGDTIAVGAPQKLTQDGLAVAITGSLVPGSYTVQYRTAAADGHPVRGSFAFVVLPSSADPASVAPSQGTNATTSPVVPAVKPETTPAPGGRRPNEIVGVTPPGERSEAGSGRWTVTRWVELIALVAVLGALGFRFGVIPRLGGPGAPLARETLDGVRRVALGALLLVFVAMFSRLAAESVALQGPERAYGVDALRALVMQTAWGHGWLVGLAGVAVGALGLALAGRAMPGAWLVALIGGALLCVSPALTGHAVAGDAPGVAVPTDALHVAGAGVWMGSLLMLALVGLPTAARGESPDGSRGARARVLVTAFSPIALGAAAVVVVTGLVSAWLRLGSFGALWGSDYGRVLLLKLCAVAALVGFGAYNWRVMTPALGDDASLQRIRRSAAAELLIAVVILAITAILIATPLPGEQAAAAAATTVQP